MYLETRIQNTTLLAQIRHNLVIHSSPNIVYEAIATEQGVRNWWTVQAQITTEIGGTAEFSFGDKYYIKMEITELDPGKKVAWLCLVGDEQWVGTEFSFEVKDLEDEVLLHFSQSKWDSETEFFAHCNFQWGIYLLSLKNFCETGKGQPFKPINWLI